VLARKLLPSNPEANGVATYPQSKRIAGVSTQSSAKRLHVAKDAASLLYEIVEQEFDKQELSLAQREKRYDKLQAHLTKSGLSSKR
jgi:hypothetical protein